MGLGHRGRPGRAGPLGGRSAGHSDQQRRGTDRAGAAAERRGRGGRAGDPDGLAVRDEGRHDLAARLEAQGLEDRGRQTGGQPGTGGADRHAADRPFGGLPLRARAPGGRRPAQRLRGPRRQPRRRRPGARGQRPGLAAAAAYARHRTQGAPRVRLGSRPGVGFGFGLRFRQGRLFRRRRGAHPEGEVPRPLPLRPVLCRGRADHQERRRLGPPRLPLTCRNHLAPDRRPRHPRTPR
ncbi:hypothetical protein SBRY_40518 [Actinacidiphila bryophytorum]|uniref:Uncharacterized protein n=1 Tax=Actinacidiphila bryophytorum TaxID=1436133 RepID=A0A9W4MD72_9ACTN|nr:hypothetical protein SBRY_40518 [Actinacidiphila bryophytorum]